jgi:hypothetical protein
LSLVWLCNPFITAASSTAGSVQTSETNRLNEHVLKSDVMLLQPVLIFSGF